MSWKDTLENNRFAIQTGDGKVFYPLWQNAAKVKDFNITAFDFIDVPGSYVDRRKPKSSKYEILIYFQGENCITEAKDFENSADDSRYWIINHPIYGSLKGQPISISRNDSTINIVELSIEFWDSIVDKYVEDRTSIKDDISDKKNEMENASANNFELKTKPTPANQNKVLNFLNTIDSVYTKFFDNSGYNEFQKVLSQRRDSDDDIIVSSTSLILDVGRTMDTIKNMPNLNVFQKLDAISNVFDQVTETFSIENISDFDRYYYETAGASIVSTMALVCLNPNENDFVSRSDVQKTLATLDDTYSKYIEKLNTFESGKNNKNNSFSSNFEVQSKLNFITKKTLYYTFSISFSFKQERIIELGSDSNLILLTHKYMGLDLKDENIELFRRINGIKNDTLFIVKKGSKIKYIV
jgi:hypothetical protein